MSSAKNAADTCNGKAKLGSHSAFSWETLTGCRYPSRQEQPDVDRFRYGATYLFFSSIVKSLTAKIPHTEGSIPLRCSLFLSELVALIATFSVLDWPSGWFLYVMFLAVGHLYSYANRGGANCLTKICISVYMVFVLLVFFRNLFASPYDTREALALLLAGLLVGHTFDIPKRQDINYSIIVSLLLISFSAISANNMFFGATVLLYFLSLLFVLYYHAASCGSEIAYITPFYPVTPSSKALMTQSIERRKALFLNAKQAVWTVLSVLVIGLIIFIVTPRFPVISFYNPRHHIKFGFNLERSNKGRDIIQPTSSSDKEARSELDENLKNDYINFNAKADLTHRGTLSHALQMNVRSTRSGLYYRGLAFRHYDGWQWTLDSATPDVVPTDSFLNPKPRTYRRFANRGFRHPVSYKYMQASQPVTQIFYVERNMPNVILGAYFASTMHFPIETFYQDKDNNFRSPDILHKDTIYTVQSFLPSHPDLAAVAKSNPELNSFVPLPKERELLKVFKEGQWQSLAAPSTVYDINLKKDKDINYRALAPLLHLPKSVTKRTRLLAKHLTANYQDPYIKATALCHFLSSNFVYQTPPPPYPTDQETVDYFLFNAQVGHCEQFATAMAVMCRSIGLPSRYVTGYGQGTYNPFSGAFEILASDAHAWTEVFIPDLGWIPFDATSPYTLGTSTRGQERSMFAGGDMLKYMYHRLPDSWQDKTSSYLQAVLNRQSTIITLTVSIGLILAMFICGFWIYRHKQSVKEILSLLQANDLSWSKRLKAIAHVIRSAPVSQLIINGGSKDSAQTAYQLMLLFLSEQNIYKQDWQTPRQFAASISSPNLRNAVEQITAHCELIIYGGRTEQEAEQQTNVEVYPPPFDKTGTVKKQTENAYQEKTEVPTDRSTEPYGADQGIETANNLQIHQTDSSFIPTMEGLSPMLNRKIQRLRQEIYKL